MLTDPEFLSNPYPDLTRIREMGAVHLDPVSGIYFVTRSREFSAMAKTPDMGRDTRFWADGWNSRETGSAIPALMSCSRNSSRR